MGIITLERRFCMESKFLSQNLEKHLYEKIETNITNECTKEHGHFIKLVKINGIKDNYISSNCENIFIVSFDIENLKPEVGNVYKGDVCMIYSGGMMINIENILKVFIPVSTLKDYEFIQLSNSFSSKKRKIIQGDIITIELSGVKYSKKKFSCFGKIKEGI